MAWALASPIGASPDDDFHLDSIWCANAANTAACKPGTTPVTRVVPKAIHDSALCYAHKPRIGAACQAKAFTLDSTPTVVTDRGNFNNQYPPVYYATMSIFVSPDILGSVVLMRLVNILVLIGMTTALFWLLPRERRPALIWGWILSTVPLGLFLLASNNPSSWALIGIGSAWLALLGYFETSGRRKVGLGILFALAMIIAAGSRGDTAVYAVMSVGIVFILTFRFEKKYFVSAILPVVFSLIAVYFYYSSLQRRVADIGLSNGGAGGGAPVRPDKLPSWAYNLFNVQDLWAGVFGGWSLGWLDTALPAIVVFGGVACFIGVAFVGMSRHWGRKSWSVVLVGLTLWLLPAYILVQGGQRVGDTVQPRYLLPLFVLLAGLTVLTTGKKRLKFSSFQLVFVVGALSIAQSIALHTNIRRYVTGVDVYGWNLDSPISWWWSIPFSPMFVWIVGSAAFAALVAILVREITGEQVTKRVTSTFKR